MIKIENISVMNIENALRGARNPLQSWEQSDSYKDSNTNEFIVGEKDKKLAMKLIKAGSDHSKFMRQIFVSMDITAPLYFFKEFDTYKVSTVANSTSTMHTIHKRKLTEDDFSWDFRNFYTDSVLDHLNSLIEDLQKLNTENQSNFKEYKLLWRMLIQHLPDSFNQLRTWTANYQTLRNIYHARQFHKLNEWREFCKVIETLPCKEFITD